MSFINTFNKKAFMKGLFWFSGRSITDWWIPRVLNPFSVCTITEQGRTALQSRQNLWFLHQYYLCSIQCIKRFLVPSKLRQLYRTRTMYEKSSLRTPCCNRWKRGRHYGCAHTVQKLIREHVKKYACCRVLGTSFSKVEKMLARTGTL